MREKNEADSVHLVLQQVAKHGIAATNSQAAPMAHSNEKQKRIKDICQTKDRTLRTENRLVHRRSICVIVLWSLTNIVVCSQELVKRL